MVRPLPLLLILLGCGCQQGPFVTVHVSSIPPGARSLPVSLSLGRQPALDGPPFDLGDATGQTDRTFGVHLPFMMPGQLVLGAAAFDQAGGKGTLLATGRARAEIGTADADLPLVLMAAPQPAKSPNCPEGPFLFSAAPQKASTQGGTEVHLSGWGFRPAGLIVQFDNTPASATWLSAAELLVLVPQRRGLPGPVEVKVQNQDGCMTTASGLFSYFAGTIDFAYHQTSYPAGRAPVAMAVGHIDSASHNQQDLVLCSATDDSVTVLLNTQTQDGSLAAKGVQVKAGTHPAALVLGDVNGDGKDDLLIADQGKSQVRVVLNQGDMLPQTAFDQALAFDAGVRPRAISLGLLGMDQRPGVAVIGDVGVSGVASVLLGDGLGKLSAPSPYLVGLFPSALALFTSRPGHPPDLLVGQLGEVGLGVLRNNGMGTFSVARGVKTAGGGATLLAAGDVDGDGTMDLVAGSQSQVWLYLNDGQGALREPIRIMQDLQLSALVLGDLDLDGLPDLVLANAADSTLIILRNTFADRGAAQPFTPVEAARKHPLGVPRSLLLGNVNQDALPDLLVALGNGTDDKVVVDVLLNGSQ